MIKKSIALPKEWKAEDFAQAVVKVECSGSDVEYWGGNFGTRFSSERLYMQVSQAED